MQNATFAIRAYENSARFRSQRDQEAAIFRRVSALLRQAKTANRIQQVRALADNRRLWITVLDLMRDPTNALPVPLRASIISIGLTVHREMDQEDPDFDFLISINDNLAAGLSGQP
jgi:flagellar biosynthesis regulator FlaF